MANRAFERQEAGGFLRQKVLEFSNTENPYPKRKPSCGWIVVIVFARAKGAGMALSRPKSVNLIASIVCRIAIFLIVLPGICRAEEDSELSLPALKKTDSGQKQGVRKDSRSLP
jgi:hypothetical protein